MITRRTLLRSTVASAGALAFAGVLSGLHGVAAQAGPPLRRSFGEMDLDDPDLVTFREFVTLMKDPSRDGQPVSWVGFADVHGTLAAGFNLCPHGNWYFLPWHRGYLRMYEVAARTLTGNQDFALPYWDWTADRQIPRAFSDETFDGQPNPLFVPNRDMGPDDSLPDNIVGQQDVMDVIYAETNFEAFGSSRASLQDSLDPMWIRRRGTSGTLEATPHDNIHCIVGGPFMCSGASPQDPIFMAHHGNIDRIWAVWKSLGRVNTSDSLWLDMPLTDNFIAPDGMTYTDIVRNLQEVEPLGYTYGLGQDEPYPDDPGRTLYLATLFGNPATLESTGVARLAASPGNKAEALRPLGVPLQPNAAGLQRSVRPAAVKGLEAAGLRAPQVYAVIRNLDPSKAEGTQLRVFVNCDYLSQAVPTSDPHYVTTIGFFGVDAHSDGHADHKPSSLVNLTPALKRLARGKRLTSDEVVVQLLPAPQAGRTLDDVGPVAAGEVELVIV